MAFGPSEREKQARIGTATPHAVEVLTHGKLRKSMLGTDAVEEWTPVASDPAAPPSTQGRFFFRTSGAGKGQLCVRWTSGAIQILATEP